MSSSAYVDTPIRQFQAGAAIAKNLRVKLTTGKLAAAGNTDTCLGTLTEASFASGDYRGVRLRTAQGTQVMVAAAAITAGNPVYAAASGKVDASGSVYEGIALTAAAADGDYIEVLPAGQSDGSGSTGGTTAAAFLVDNNSAIPKIELASQVGGTGDFKVTIKPAATLTANRVVTVPDAATQVMVGDTATQTLTNKTLTSPTVNTPTMTINTATLAAAGTIQGDAGAIVTACPCLILATGADATKGIQLPTAAAGLIVIVKNRDSDNAVLKVWPFVGDGINAVAVNSAFSMAAKTSCLFVAYDATTWYTLPLLAS